MKNLTLRVDERSLERAREVAAERSTSVNALIREYLEELGRQASRREAARAELLELCRESKAKVGSMNWKRDELHAR
ncbi:MAG: DUF6364 family protein [Oceanipulchritudo sp.]